MITPQEGRRYELKGGARVPCLGFADFLPGQFRISNLDEISLASWARFADILREIPAPGSGLTTEEQGAVNRLKIPPTLESVFGRADKYLADIFTVCSAAERATLVPLEVEAVIQAAREYMEFVGGLEGHWGHVIVVLEQILPNFGLPVQRSEDEWEALNKACAEWKKRAEDNKALAVRKELEIVEAFVERCNARAETEMLTTHKIEGAHNRAMIAELAALRSATDAKEGE